VSRILAALVVFLGLATNATAGSVTLTWDASTSDEVAGYIVVFGTLPGVYPYAISAGNHTFAVVDGLASGVNYYFAIKAYSYAGGLSEASNEVSASTTNAAPTLGDPGPQLSSEGSAVHLQLLGSDPDGDQLTYSATGLPDGLFMNNSTGIIYGTPSYTSSGVYDVTFSVSDGFLEGTLTASRTVTWTVLNVNGPPAVQPIPDQTTAENQLVTLNVIGTDADGDFISWSAVGLPTGLSIDATTGTIAGIPTFASAGTYPVTVIATAAGMTGRRNFVWTVINVDRPPVLAAIPSQTSGQYSTVLLAASANDPDGDAVTFSATGLPPGLAIDPTNGRITGTLSPASVGGYSVTVTASAGGLTDNRTFAWTVTNQAVFPLKVSANGRYLVDQNNVPFLMLGDSPQTIIGNLSVADATTFLTDRKDRGFNTVWINLVCRTAVYGCSDSGSTFDGIAPFSTADDLSTPNEAYFARADAILSVASSLNLLVILDPIDTGGWLTTLGSNSPATVRAYGQFLGNRYKNFDNIIWMSGNDFQTWSVEDDDAKVRGVALGIRDVDSRHLHTVELDYLHYSSSSLDDPTWAPIVGLEASYTYYPTYFEVLRAYNRPSFLPVFLAEANYEGENNFRGTDIDVPVRQRRQEYWTALSGATGQLFGNAYTWTFADDWQSHLNTPGTTEFGYLKSLFESRAWFRLIPDQTHTIVTSGYGTFSNPAFGVEPIGTDSILGNDYATAAATSDGSLVMAYLPTVRTVTVDMSRLSGPSVARWFDPTLGTFVSIPGSPFLNSGTAAFTPPGTHADEADDWVLVLESNPGIVFTNPGNRTNPGGASVSLPLVASGPIGEPLTYYATNLPLNLTINAATGVISGTLATTDATYNVTVTATDGTLTASRSFAWTVTSSNAPPVLTNPGDQTSDSGTTVSLQLAATDPDGIGLFYSATGLPPGLTVNSTTGLIFGTLSNVTATYGVTATVSDGVLSNSQTFTWTVSLGSAFVQANYAAPQSSQGTVTVPFNAAQTAGNLNVVVVGWNDTVRHVQSVSDTNGNVYLLAVGPTVTGALSQSIYYATNIGAATAGSNSVSVTFDGAANMPDIRIAEYRGIDPMSPVDVVAAAQGSSTLSDSGSVTTGHANDVLVAANTVTNTTTGAGSGYVARLITFPDSDILMDRVVATAGSYNATAPVTPGVWIMQLVAFRAAGGALNQPPTLNVIPDQTNAETAVVSLQLIGGDPDGNPITYSVAGLPPGLSVNPATGLLSGALSYTSAGVYSVTATVSDYSLTVSRSFTWTVTNTNRAPIIKPIPDQADIEHRTVTFNVVATDPDGEALTFSATGLPLGLAIDSSTGVIGGILSYSSAGQHPVTVTVNDGQGATNSSASTTFYWTVTNANRAPVVSGLPDRTDAESTSITLNVIAIDPDADDTLSYGAAGLPAGLSINPATGVISGTLSYASAGPHLVIVNVFDGTDTASQSFIWTVTNVDRVPVVAAIPSQTNAENTSVSLAVTATDPDGDALTFSATGLPPGLTINSSSGTISGLLTYAGAGTYGVIVTASDGTLNASQNFTWTVTNVDRAPVLSAMGNMTTATGTAVTLEAAATDPDSDALTYAATGLPAGVTIASDTGLLSGAPSVPGVYNVTISVSDGNLSGSASFVWTVSSSPAGRVTFIQAHSSSLVSALPVVTVSYPAAQLAASLNVVVVGWKDPTAQVLSVSDAKGNLYQLAVGPTTRPEIGAQAVYYASNVEAAAAGANILTVTFTSPAEVAELRIIEYQGIEPTNVVDVTTGAQGNDGLADSGAATTSFRNDLLFGAVWASSATTTPGGGLTARLTTPSGTLFEDATVAATGNYSVQASITPPSPWIVQMVAFRDINHPPTLGALGPLSSTIGSSVAITVPASDEDNDPLTFAVTNLPQGLQIGSTSGSITGTFASSSAGFHTVTVSVSDGQLSSSQTFLWTVANANGVPVMKRLDFDGDGRSDPVVFTPATGTWSILRSGTNTVLNVVLGAAGDVPVPGDYDGDGRTDAAIWHRATGVWSILTSSSNYTTSIAVTLGASTDVPVPGDYDGDGQTDVAVFSAATGAWTILKSSTGFTATTSATLGTTGDIPVQGNYDGDGKTDVGIYRPSTGTWTILKSSTNNASSFTFAWGNGTDTPVPADYDGDGRTDVAVFRGATGTWYILKSGANFTSGVSYVLGTAADMPVPGDYDGDGRADVAFFRPATGAWSILQSSSNYTVTTSLALGGASDLPVPNLQGVTPPTPPAAAKLTSTSDYDGDGKSDVAVFTAASGVWSILKSSDGSSLTATLGVSGDVPVPGDYDGDGKTDVAVYRPSAGSWLIKTSSSNFTNTMTVTLGGSADVPVPGDYDGDGKTDVAVYHGATGLWTILKSSTGFVTSITITLGVTSDVPVPGDYDGDGKTDVAVYHGGTWSILQSSTGYSTSRTFAWGGATDVPVVGDYDGDGKADVVVYRRSTGIWYVLQSKANFTAGVSFVLGSASDTPMAGDFDGDGKFEPAVYRSSTGVWSMLMSHTNYTATTLTLGSPEDLPVPNVIAAVGSGTQAHTSDAMRSTDYDGDRKSDVALYRPSTGVWSILRSGSGYASGTPIAWGATTDIPVAGDYDGDGKTDIAVYRPSSGTWFVLRSQTNFTAGVTYVWGSGTDVPVPGDYDGDGTTDLAVFHLATGTWQIKLSSTGATMSIAWGTSGDIPVPGDYDGDRRTDLAVFRPATGTWSILKSSTGYTGSFSKTWGRQGDVPVFGDFDGDDKTDITIYRPSTGTWFILQSNTNFTAGLSYTLGVTGDVPIPGDYDGDGKTDLAVYRASAGETLVFSSSSGFASTVTIVGGGSDDTAALSPLAFESQRSDTVRSTDYDGDRIADIGTYNPTTATWSILKSSTNYLASLQMSFGQVGDVPEPGDYDGDGLTDLATYHPSTGLWSVLHSSTGFTTSMTVTWGSPGDVPVPADYDGDGRTDIAVYRPSTGTWFILRSKTNFTAGMAFVLGASTDVPAPGDYDGDGRADLAVYSPSTGQWQVATAATSYTSGFTVGWGGHVSDVPVPGDYDGDRKHDIAIYRASTNTYFILQSKTGFTAGVSYTVTGSGTAAPVVGDYDGDGRIDLSLFSSSDWIIKLSGGGYNTSLLKTWGGPSDLPLP